MKPDNGMTGKRNENNRDKYEGVRANRCVFVRGRVRLEVGASGGDVLCWRVRGANTTMIGRHLLGRNYAQKAAKEVLLGMRRDRT
jgi:hypothetical protein